MNIKDKMVLRQLEKDWSIPAILRELKQICLERENHFNNNPTNSMPGQVILWKEVRKILTDTIELIIKRS